MSDHIGPVRPIFNLSDEPPKSKKCERLIAGGKNSGMLIDVTKNGIEINGYYLGFSGRDTRYANLSKPVIIPWEEIDKLKERIQNPKRKKKAKLDRIEREVDAKYLETLPIVTINGKRYYIDPNKYERRDVNNPHQVWSFGK